MKNQPVTHIQLPYLDRNGTGKKRNYHSQFNPIGEMKTGKDPWISQVLERLTNETKIGVIKGRGGFPSLYFVL